VVVKAAKMRRQSAAYVLALVACLVMGGVQAAHAEGGGAASLYLDTFLGIVLLVACSVATASAIALAASHLGHRPKIRGALVAGLGFALTLPAQTPVLPASIAIAFGWIVGREVFGGSERSFVHPAVLAHIFLALTWPQSLGTASQWLRPEREAAVPWNELWMASPGGAIGASSGLACLLGALVLLVLGRISWRILIAVPIGMAIGLGLLGHISTQAPAYALSSHLLMGSVLFGVIFFATDPHSSPTSNSGCWAHGVLIGFVIILLRLANPTSPDGTMSAILVASVFAPLFDHAAVAGRAKWPRASA